MAKSKGIGSLSREIAQALSEYTSEIEEGLEKSKVEVAKGTVKNLKITSPEQTGDYAKGWARKKIGTAQVVYNRTDYQLTHLLENGHVNRDGSRTQSTPHIAPAEDKAIDEFMKKVEKVIKG
ncbi:hypothetical protein [Metabacillus halosaccharovorans]|uniref:hypothetical protein n=1 Tax=Metabacillus halosaccharovorans TaxID=930124 RepID=UPI0009949444|nr:hypothetical protein [Metabacillus halosaccharovorans]